MLELLTKSRARNIFFESSVSFVIVFIGLTVNSHK
jgi:nitric oxide reductase subunit C